MNTEATELVKIAKSLTAAKKAIELVKIPGSIMKTEDRYMIRFRGEEWGQLYYNMRGYVAEKGIPVPSGEKAVGLSIGEKGLSAFKREIRDANREWAELGDVKVAKSITSAMNQVFGFSDDVELGYDPFGSTIEIGIGGEWWGGKVKMGKNVYTHRKESVDPAYKPVTVVVRKQGHVLTFDVMGGFGVGVSFNLSMKG